MSSYEVPNGNNNYLPHNYKNDNYIIEVYQKCIKIGELSGVSYSVARKPAPIYTSEENINKHKENIKRGKLGINGSVIFKVLNKEDVIENKFNIRIISECNVMCIINMELIKEGKNVSLKDISLNQQYTFIANDIMPWFNQLDRK